MELGTVSPQQHWSSGTESLPQGCLRATRKSRAWKKTSECSRQRLGAIFKCNSLRNRWRYDDPSFDVWGARGSPCRRDSPPEGVLNPALRNGLLLTLLGLKLGPRIRLRLPPSVLSHSYSSGTGPPHSTPYPGPRLVRQMAWRTRSVNNYWAGRGAELKLHRKWTYLTYVTTVS